MVWWGLYGNFRPCRTSLLSILFKTTIKSHVRNAGVLFLLLFFLLLWVSSVFFSPYCIWFFLSTHTTFFNFHLRLVSMSFPCFSLFLFSLVRFLFSRSTLSFWTLFHSRTTIKAEITTGAGFRERVLDDSLLFFYYSYLPFFSSRTNLRIFILVISKITTIAKVRWDTKFAWQTVRNFRLFDRSELYRRWFCVNFF